MAIKAILVDDEPLALAELQSMLNTLADLDVIASCDNPVAAIEAIQTLRPDLVFLDINMPGKSGFDLLQELEDCPSVIFVTAYDEYALKAFEVNALDYLLKPVSVKRLEEAVDKVRKSIAREAQEENRLPADKKIFIKDGEQCFFVPLQEIFLIESVGNYARMYFRDQKPLMHKSLQYLDERLPESAFFRVSRQHIINIHFIKNIVPYFNSTLQVELLNGMKIDISQRQSARFREKMGI